MSKSKVFTYIDHCDTVSANWIGDLTIGSMGTNGLTLLIKSTIKDMSLYYSKFKKFSEMVYKEGIWVENISELLLILKKEESEIKNDETIRGYCYNCKWCQGYCLHGCPVCKRIISDIVEKKNLIIQELEELDRIFEEKFVRQDSL